MSNRTFTVDVISNTQSGAVVSVFLGDPKKMGREAEHVMTINESLIPALIADLKNFQMNKGK